MPNNTKTFRLFISSTFDDFKLERDVLQEKVFPKLSELCNKHGFDFMPIDLRWGINQEAQIDQKTIELCLNEVKACKSEPHPDFIIMLGDRYGWIPLPYHIEASVFESIYNNIPSDKREKTDFWYRLDLNALPASYILQKREKNFIPFENWQQEELEIKTILQQAMPAQQINNYFISATEIEYREYISELIAKKENSLYFINRKIEKNGYENTRFFEEENKLLIFKQELQSEINIDNQLILKTCFSSHNHLDISYLDEFADFLIYKLSDSIHKEITRIHSIASSIKSDIHLLHKANLSNMIIGRDVEIQYILDYISDKKNKQPLIIYGPSGIGKSTIMASTINRLEEKSKYKIIYRFAGLDKEASTTKSILMSIFQDLGFKIENYALDNREDYVNKINNLFFEVKDPIVIFIDALDQLDDQDNYEWLPSILPDNIKIIMSVLKDDNYIEDNFYYEKLSQLSTNLYEISPLDSLKDARQIIIKNIEIYDRTLQQNQLDYVLKQYSNVNSPLYLKIVSEEIRHWPSNKKEFELAHTQQNAITEYIKSLTTLYHHEKLLVDKVFAYMYASQETLTESLLYEILSNDQELIQVVERAEHRNTTHKLPMAIWARLYKQVSPFLKENENGHLKFFHREFKDAANKLYSYDHSQKLLSILELMTDINHYQNIKKELINVHSKTLVNQQKNHPDKSIEKQINYIKKQETLNQRWEQEYLDYIDDKGHIYFEDNNLNWAIAYFEITYLMSLALYENKVSWSKDFIKSTLNLSNAYWKNYRLDDSKKLLEKNMDLFESLYKNNNSEWEILYSEFLEQLGRLNSNENVERAIELKKKSLFIREEGYKRNPTLWVESYLTSYVNISALLHKNNDKGAIHYLETFLEIFDNLSIDTITDNISKSYFAGLTRLSQIYIDQEQYPDAAALVEKALNTCEHNFNMNPSKWNITYTELQNQLSQIYYKQNQFDAALQIQKKAHEVREKYYRLNPCLWGEIYMTSLSNLAHGYNKLSIKKNQITTLVDEAILICERLYKNNSNKFRDFFIDILKFQAKHHIANNKKEDAIKYYEKAYNISVESYGATHYKTLELKKIYFPMKKKIKK